MRKGPSHDILEWVACDLCGGKKALTLFRCDINGGEYPEEFKNTPHEKFNVQKCLEQALPSLRI